MWPFHPYMWPFRSIMFLPYLYCSIAPPHRGLYDNLCDRLRGPNNKCLCSRQLDSVDISVSSQVSPVYGRPLGDASSVSTYIDSRKRFKPLPLLSYRLSVSQSVLGGLDNMGVLYKKIDSLDDQLFHHPAGEGKISSRHEIMKVVHSRSLRHTSRVSGLQRSIV
jgi:hypothetical protein